MFFLTFFLVGSIVAKSEQLKSTVNGNIFSKKLAFLTHLRTWNVSFSENVAYALSGWSLQKVFFHIVIASLLLTFDRYFPFGYFVGVFFGCHCLCYSLTRDFFVILKILLYFMLTFKVSSKSSFRYWFMQSFHQSFRENH